MNKGFLVANLRVAYELANPTTGVKETITQTGSITYGQGIFRFPQCSLILFLVIQKFLDYAFYIPKAVAYATAPGATLYVDAFGFNILTQRITENPECYHIWGNLGLF